MKRLIVKDLHGVNAGILTLERAPSLNETYFDGRTKRFGGCCGIFNKLIFKVKLRIPDAKPPPFADSKTSPPLSQTATDLVQATMSLLRSPASYRLANSAARLQISGITRTSIRNYAAADPSVQPEPKTTSEEKPTGGSGEAGLIRQEGPSAGSPRHQPDYNVAVDYRTSYVVESRPEVELQ